MVVDSSEMFVDFTGTVSRVAEFAGLPKHDFEYDPKHEFRGICTKRRHRHGPDFFAEGGRCVEKEVWGCCWVQRM